MPIKSYWDKAKYWIFKDRIPVTMSLLVYSMLIYVLASFGLGIGILEHMIFTSRGFITSPWSLVTYPLVPVLGSIFGFLASMFWLWIAGGTLERSWGPTKFAAYMVLNTVVSALGLLIGGILTGHNMQLLGLWLPLAGMTVAFAAKNPNESVLFAFVIPLKLKYLAVISAASVLISFAYGGFIVAVFALLGCAFSLWYATGIKLPFDFKPRPKPKNVIRVYPRESATSKLNPFKSIKERQEQERLKNILKKSGIDEK